MKRFLLFVCILVLPNIAGATQAPARVAESVTLDAVASKSADIFCGVCVDAKPEIPNIANFRTIYTFLVNDVSKGNYVAGQKITWKQATGFKGAVTYELNKSYCVALTPESPSGVRAPYGVFFGKWDVDTAPDGSKVLRGAIPKRIFYRNVLDRRPTLSKSLTTREKDALINGEDSNSRDIDYDIFMSTIRKINQTNSNTKTR